MDPTNNSTSMPSSAPNPTPTPTPMSGSMPTSDLTPSSSLTSSAEEAANTAGMPTSGGAISGAAASGATAPSIPEPTTPTPGASAMPTQATAAGGMTTPPVNPIIQPTGGGVSGAAPKFNGFAATDPIMMPEPAPEPDPIEEELKSPMKAAAPAPGSIGSAMSGPSADGGVPAMNSTNNPFTSDDKKTPNVAFNDPATQPEMTAPTSIGTGKPKSKNNKTTLIALIVVSAIIVIVLVVVLVMQLMGNGGSSTTGSSPNEPVAIEDTDSGGGSGDSDGGSSDGSGGAVIEVVKTLSCTRAMDEGEIDKQENLASGTIFIEAGFDNNDELAQISMRKSAVRSGENATGESEDIESHEDVASELEFATAVVYDLPIGDNEDVIMDFESIKANYEQLDFTCEVL